MTLNLENCGILYIAGSGMLGFTLWPRENAFGLLSILQN